jgi:hypothetical protein
MLAETSPLDEATGASIDLAIAQWMRSPRATSEARERLRALGVADEEIEERRRCRSSQPQLAAVLRLAVVLVIARGRLEPTDRAHLPADGREALIDAVARAVSLAVLRVSLATAAVRSYAPIDIEVGDY